jgi:hypothetical protein
VVDSPRRQDEEDDVMTFTPAKPPEETVPVTVDQKKALNVFHLHEIKINHDPNTGSNRVQIIWSQGYVTGEGEEQEYVAAVTKKTVVEGDVLAAIMMEPVKAKTNYPAIKSATWTMLARTGVLPDGKVG